MLIFLSMRRWLLKFFFIALTIFAFGRGYYLLTDDFRMGNVIFDLPQDPQWTTPPLTADEQSKVDKILSQEFYYIGKGAQSYAFGSEDGRYVLKLFKLKHMKPSFFVKMLPSLSVFDHYKTKYFERKKYLLDRLFAGYILAFQKNKEESGVIYVHLNKAQAHPKPLVIHDKVGLRHVVEPSQVYFVVQEKGTPTEAVLRNALDSGNIDLAKKRMHQIFDLYLTEYSKGLADKDLAVLRNTGFVGERPIHFDVGELMEDDEVKRFSVRMEDFDIIARQFDQWFKVNYPRDHPQFVQEIRTAMARVAAH